MVIRIRTQAVFYFLGLPLIDPELLVYPYSSRLKNDAIQGSLWHVVPILVISPVFDIPILDRVNDDGLLRFS